MNETDWINYFLEFEGATQDDATDKKLSLFRIGEDGAIFAGLEKSTKPLRLNFRCDRLLAKTLRERYETILPANKFDARTWNTVIMAGQLTDEEVKDFARLSYNLTAEA